ncbi:putative GPI-anchored surface protein [Diplonema papillatum]|nr:putative GPI-anchored surface protein [Diplonema papillatum]
MTHDCEDPKQAKALAQQHPHPQQQQQPGMSALGSGGGGVERTGSSGGSTVQAQGPGQHTHTTDGPLPAEGSAPHAVLLPAFTKPNTAGGAPTGGGERPPGAAPCQGATTAEDNDWLLGERAEDKRMEPGEHIARREEAAKGEAADREKQSARFARVVEEGSLSSASDDVDSHAAADRRRRRKKAVAPRVPEQPPAPASRVTRAKQIGELEAPSHAADGGEGGSGRTTDQSRRPQANLSREGFGKEPAPAPVTAPVKSRKRRDNRGLLVWVLGWGLFAVWGIGGDDESERRWDAAHSRWLSGTNGSASDVNVQLSPPTDKRLQVQRSSAKPPTVGSALSVILDSTYDSEHLPSRPEPPPSSDVCVRHRQLFFNEYANAMSAVNFSRPPKYELKFRWADNDAFCGRFLLWNLTRNDMWHAVGRGLGNANTNTPTTISLHNCVVAWDSLKSHCTDLHVTARLVGPTYVWADVVKRTDECAYDITYTVYEPGQYELFIKFVHLNGSSVDAAAPVSLGADRSRVRLNGKKLFAKHKTCGSQKNLQGSPFTVIVTGAPRLNTTSYGTPRCAHGNYTRGHWIRFPSNDYCQKPQPYCEGTPWWLSDAYAYNQEWLWAPKDCHYVLYSPTRGPGNRCFARQGSVGIIGDSIAREYAQNCKLFHMWDEAGLRCEHWHMIIKGEAFSKQYANSVVKVVVDKVHTDKPVAIAANLGMMHMIGVCNDSAWEYFMSTFANELARRPTSFPVRKIWLGAPQVHYATRGMSQHRTERWDAISMKHLKPLGFELLYATAVTRSREEGSWDGLHNAAEKGKKQSKVKNKRVKEWGWNGGISHMLWNVLLNMLCAANNTGH